MYAWTLDSQNYPSICGSNITTHDFTFSRLTENRFSMTVGSRSSNCHDKIADFFCISPMNLMELNLESIECFI